MPRINRTFSQKQKPRKGKESSFVFWGEENQLSELIFIFQICLVVGSNNVWKCGDLIHSTKFTHTLTHSHPPTEKHTYTRKDSRRWTGFFASTSLSCKRVVYSLSARVSQAVFGTCSCISLGYIRSNLNPRSKLIPRKKYGWISRLRCCQR